MAALWPSLAAFMEHILSIRTPCTWAAEATPATRPAQQNILNKFLIDFVSPLRLASTAAKYFALEQRKLRAFCGEARKELANEQAADSSNDQDATMPKQQVLAFLSVARQLQHRDARKTGNGSQSGSEAPAHGCAAAQEQPEYQCGNQRQSETML